MSPLNGDIGCPLSNQKPHKRLSKGEEFHSTVTVVYSIIAVTRLFLRRAFRGADRG